MKKTNNTKSVSVAMATYNGEKYLKEQLDSIYAQTYNNIEVIVTDDGSTDNTIDILEQYARLHGLKYFVNETNLGFVRNFEKAISLCQGDYIALADQDDIWEKEKLEILISEIGSNLLIHSDCSIIDEQGAMISSNWKEMAGYCINIKNLLFANVVTGCTVVFKKDLLNIVFPFPEGLAYHDWWLAICAASVDKIVYTPKPLTRYRQHVGQNTGAGINKKSSLFKIAYLNIRNRWHDIDTPRVIAFKKHRENLQAAKGVKCIEKYASALNDVTLYVDDYLKHKLHIKTFLISLKYHRTLYPHRNYFYLKNILMDIIG